MTKKVVADSIEELKKIGHSKEILKYFVDVTDMDSTGKFTKMFFVTEPPGCEVFAGIIFAGSLPIYVKDGNPFLAEDFFTRLNGKKQKLYLEVMELTLRMHIEALEDFKKRLGLFREEIVGYQKIVGGEYDSNN